MIILSKKQISALCGFMQIFSDDWSNQVIYPADFESEKEFGECLVTAVNVLEAHNARENEKLPEEITEGKGFPVGSVEEAIFRWGANRGDLFTNDEVYSLLNDIKEAINATPESGEWD